MRWVEPSGRSEPTPLSESRFGLWLRDRISSVSARLGWRGEAPVVSLPATTVILPAEFDWDSDSSDLAPEADWDPTEISQFAPEAESGSAGQIYVLDWERSRRRAAGGHR